MSSSRDSPISSSLRRPSSRRINESYRLDTSRISFTRKGIRFSKPSKRRSAWDAASCAGRVVVKYSLYLGVSVGLQLGESRVIVKGSSHGGSGSVTDPPAANHTDTQPRAPPAARVLDRLRM